MKSVSVTELKAHCLELVDQVSATGESLLVTERGKPVAVLSPPPQAIRNRYVPGLFEDKAKIVGDIIAPLDEDWEGKSSL